MSNLHLFPLTHLGAPQLCKLASNLSRAHYGEADLGSRRPHIEATARDLRVMTEKLRSIMETMEADGAEADSYSSDLVVSIRRYIVNAEAIAAKAVALSDAAAEAERVAQRCEAI